MISARKCYNFFGTVSISRYTGDNDRHSEKKSDYNKIDLDPGIPHDPREVVSRHSEEQHPMLDWWSAYTKSSDIKA